MFGVRLKSKSKKRNFITSGSVDNADSRVVMFCEDIPSERSSTDSGSGAPSNVHRKEGQGMTRSTRPTKMVSSQKIHHMKSPLPGHNVGHSTLCIRDQYGSLQYSTPAGGSHVDEVLHNLCLLLQLSYGTSIVFAAYRCKRNFSSLDLNLVYPIQCPIIYCSGMCYYEHYRTIEAVTAA